jgi:hypothetical protein
MSCIVLHNFIRDSKLYDKEFDKCDTNEEYIPRESNTISQTQGDDEIDEGIEVTMNIIRDRIGTALANTRAS